MKRSRRVLSRASIGAVVLAVAAGARGADPNAYEPLADPGVGFNLISWWNFGGNGSNVWRNAVNDLDAAGFDEVSISPVRYVNDNTGAIATSSSRGPELSHLSAGIARAKELGMSVTVNPFVELENFAYWRGFYDPTPGSGEWNTFWDDYEQYMVDIAVLAESHGVEAMNIGTEYRTLTRNPANNAKWGEVIDAVDAVFSGDIGYAANWDNYNHPNLDDAIWNHPAIDYVGVDSYFTNTVSNSAADNSGTDPNEAFISQVEAGWNNRLDNQILSYADTLQGGAGLPVVLTEVGYLPYNRTSVTPQNSSGPIDTDEQVMAFRGLLRALDGRGDDVPAIHIWQWGMPGSNGSQWNINADTPLDQPNNLQLGQFLSSFVSNPVVPLVGDADGDGDVDGDDLIAVQSNFGATGPAPLVGDADGDGDVDGDDLIAVQSSFGATAATAVPEPAAVALVLLAAGATMARSRRASS